MLASDDKDPIDVIEISPETMNKLDIAEFVALLACIYNVLVKCATEVATAAHNKSKGNPTAPQYKAAMCTNGGDDAALKVVTHKATLDYYSGLHVVTVNLLTCNLSNCEPPSCMEGFNSKASVLTTCGMRDINMSLDKLKKH